MISVELLPGPGARLLINGLVRAVESGNLPCRLVLSSTLQTDYEWHEFIEASVECSATDTRISIKASNQPVAEQVFTPQEDNP